MVLRDRIELPRAPQAAAHARRFLEQRLRRHVEDAALAEAQLVVTELVTNAVRHGDGAVALEACLWPGRLRVEVVDEGTGNAPHIREQRGDESGGFGLRIVDDLALRWGAHEGTTHVWADLRAA